MSNLAPVDELAKQKQETITTFLKKKSADDATCTATVTSHDAIPSIGARSEDKGQTSATDGDESLPQQANAHYKKSKEPITCPVCLRHITSSSDAVINRHIDYCLGKSSLAAGYEQGDGKQNSAAQNEYTAQHTNRSAVSEYEQSENFAILPCLPMCSEEGSYDEARVTATDDPVSSSSFAHITNTFTAKPKSNVTSTFGITYIPLFRRSPDDIMKPSKNADDLTPERPADVESYVTTCSSIQATDQYRDIDDAEYTAELGANRFGNDGRVKTKSVEKAVKSTKDIVRKCNRVLSENMRDTYDVAEASGAEMSPAKSVALQQENKSINVTPAYNVTGSSSIHSPYRRVDIMPENEHAANDTNLLNDYVKSHNSADAIPNIGPDSTASNKKRSRPCSEESIGVWPKTGLVFDSHAEAQQHSSVQRHSNQTDLCFETNDQPQATATLEHSRTLLASTSPGPSCPHDAEAVTSFDAQNQEIDMTSTLQSASVKDVCANEPVTSSDPDSKSMYTCPVCSIKVSSTLDYFNRHIDSCLSKETIKGIVNNNALRNVNGLVKKSPGQKSKNPKDAKRRKLDDGQKSISSFMSQQK